MCTFILKNDGSTGNMSCLTHENFTRSQPAGWEEGESGEDKHGTKCLFLFLCGDANVNGAYIHTLLRWV